MRRKLTKRQNEVLMLLMRGLSNKEIARMTNSSDATIKTHVAAVLHLMGVRNRTEAAFKGVAWRAMKQDESL